MAFGIAETIASIHAGMAAIDLYLSHRPATRQQVIQTLDLEYAPSNYTAIELQILSIGDAYKDVFDSANDRVKRCLQRFAEAIRDDQLPGDRETLGRSAKKCVCKEIQLIKDFMGPNIPGDLEKIWNTHGCDK
jgi:hypothetical protein